jgi:hypothetical protein
MNNVGAIIKNDTEIGSLPPFNAIVRQCLTFIKVRLIMTQVLVQRFPSKKTFYSFYL